METREYNGVTYQRSGPGQPWVRVGGAQGGRIIPKSATTQMKEGADARGAEADAQIKSAQAPYADRVAAAEARAAAAEAALKEQQATAAAMDNANTAPPVTPEVRQARRTLQGDNVLSAIDDARGNIDWSSTGNLLGSNAFGHVPIIGQQNTDLGGSLDTIRANLSFDRLTQMREESKTGGALGSVTENELKLLSSAVASLDQRQSEDKLRKNLARIEEHYRRSMALMAGENPDQPDVAQKYGLNVADAKPPAIGGGQAPSGGGGNNPPAAPMGEPPLGGGDAVLSSEGKAVEDPALAGVNATVAAMFQRGNSAEEVRAYLNSVRPGLGDKAVGVEDAVAWAKKNPGKPIPVDLERIWEPANGVMKAIGDAALWEAPGGFSPGSALIRAGDILSFGTLDNLSANPDMARAVMSGVQERNPGSYLAGQIGGGVLSGIGAEAALGRAGLGTMGRARAGDLLLGTGYGAGSADDPNQSRLAGGAWGGLFGLAGGMAGRGTARATGRAVAGVTDSARRRLADSNVRLTVGQLLGGTTQAVEDRLAGLPLVGDRIRAMRGEGLSDFNRAAFDEALAPIGATTNGVTGEAGIDLARQARSQAYRDALDPVNVSADAPFINDMTAAIAAGRELPDPMRSGLEYTLPTRVGQAFDNQGNLSGRDFQQSIRGLRQDARAVANQPYGYDFGDVTGQAENALEGLLQRQAPDALPAYRSANEANRNIEVLRDAVVRARNGARSNEPGMFMPSQLIDASTANARRFGNTAGTTQQPLYELSRAGQEVLPSRVPDSGTAGRLTIPLLLSSGAGYANADEGQGLEGAGSGAMLGAAATALLAGPYASRTSRAVITRALLADRNPTVRAIGEEIIARDRIAGLLAAPAAVSQLGGP